MKRLTIAILFGGCSEEHDISVKSATELAATIDPQRYEPIYIGISRSGVWSMCERPCAGWEDGDLRRAVLSPDRESHGLLIADGGRLRTIRVDAVFPVLHGRFGEDGSVQGLLELSGIPYVGCDIQSSAICMDKSLAYVIARAAGIPTPEFTIVTGTQGVDLSDLAYPVFVKPARSGSSFGVAKVEAEDHLEDAISTARQFDHKVLIEEAIAGTEVGCAVLGRSTDVFVGEVDQILLTHGFFQIHQEAAPEEGSENAGVTVPAELPDEQRDRIRGTARSIYGALGCTGLARVDMFLEEDGRIVLNEVNTMPGFTSYSRFPRMMAAAGLSGTDVFERCIALAMDR